MLADLLLASRVVAVVAGRLRRRRPARAAVHGHVTVAGKPIEQGSISFVPIDGNKGPTAGGVIGNGRVLHPGQARAGDRPESGEYQRHAPTGRKVPSEGNPQCAGRRDYLRGAGPYRANSPLKCDVKSGELNFDLEAN